MFEGIRSDLDLLTKHLVIGNGKPSLLNRVDALESSAAKASKADPKEARVFKIGNIITIRGYHANDVLRIVVVIGVLWLVAKPYVSGWLK
jgi:hypothetical protein